MSSCCGKATKWPQEEEVIPAEDGLRLELRCHRKQKVWARASHPELSTSTWEKAEAYSQERLKQRQSIQS